MALDARTAQEQLTPEARRNLLRAFGDRMLLKLGNMDDPEDLPGIERAVRVAAVIERIYSRCDRAQGHAPDPNKLEAERARHMSDAIQARFELATSLEWNEKNQQRMGNWLDAAETAVKAQVPAPFSAPEAPETLAQPSAPHLSPILAPETAVVSTPATRSQVSAPAGNKAAFDIDQAGFTEAVQAARAALGLKAPNELSATGGADPPPRPPG